MKKIELATHKIIADIDAGVGRLVINNPERRNAISLDMWQGIGDAIRAFANDDDVRCVVMSGAGGKAYASGADISQFEKMRADAEAAKEYERVGIEATAALHAFPKPLIGAIRGFCMGGGLALAMTNDMRVATEASVFGIPAARLGIAYRSSSLEALVHLVGPAFAKEILITGKRYSAAEAFHMGLVNQVVADDELESAIGDLTARIVDNAPLSMKANKLTINEVLKDDSERDKQLIESLAGECFNSEDYREGRTAFMEKRKPVFRGR